MLDVAIIGGGPAALSAALNCVQRNKDVLVFSKGLEGSLLFAAEKVDNYLGMPDISGEKMLNDFYNHAIKNGVKFNESKVTQILSMGDYYAINAENEFFEAKCVILAMGLNKSKSIPGEMEFLGRGVSYCATCDGMLYKNKNVIVISENQQGEEEAKFLADICQSVVYIPTYNMTNSLNDNIKIIKDKPVSIIGENKAEAIALKTQNINADGIFMIKNTIPPESLIFDLEMENGSIKVDRSMATNLKNVFAAGDCTGAPFQIAKAVGEGLVAALSAISALGRE